MKTMAAKMMRMSMFVSGVGCDYSISQHLCGGGVNGMIVPEGSTFVVSPKWKDEYLDKNPREVL